VIYVYVKYICLVRCICLSARVGKWVDPCMRLYNAHKHIHEIHNIPLQIHTYAHILNIKLENAQFILLY